jgi:hypothetical protein
MNAALWIVQGLLALAFLGVGAMKATQPIANLAKNMGWVNDFTPTIVRLIGVAEILGALGLILPGIFHVATILTPIAATGLAIIMVGASVVHLRRKEYPNIGGPALLFALLLVVIIGRFILPLV